MSGHFKVSQLNKISEHWGESADCFLVQLHCELIKEGEPGGEAFAVTVISPRQLMSEIGENELELGRGYLIALDYDERAIKGKLQRLVDSSRAESWTELLRHIERYFDWL